MTTDVHGGGRRINGWRWAGWGLVALLLLTPAVAMRWTDEVTWTAGDFLFAAVLLGGVGLALEAAARRMADRAGLAGAALAVLAAFLLVWINAAVGIIGDEDNPLNLLYAGVLLIAGGGALLARFRAAGMARAMIAAAVAQAAVGAVAVVAGRDQPPGVVGLVLLNLAFVVLFAASAALFGRSAARTRRDAV